MAQTRYRENLDTWQTTEYVPVVTNHALVTLTPIKPTYREELWDSAVAGAKGGLKLGLIIVGGVLFVGLLTLL